MMMSSRHQEKRAYNGRYEKVKNIKYFGSSLTNLISIHKIIKYRLKAGNSCFCSFKKHFFLHDFSLRI